MAHQRLLQLSVPKMMPSTKVLLAGLLLRHPDGRFSSAQIHAHSVGLGMSARSVRRCMLELVSLCFVDVTRVSQGKKGQPMTHYELTEHLLGMLHDDKVRKQGPLDKLIAAVLLANTPLGHLKDMQTGVKGRAGLQERVSASNRLLLVIMLSHADRFGIVSELGLADLSKLTGLTRAQVEAQLFKLNQLGLIRSKIPGFSGSKLLGSSKTVYFLNLHHPDYLDTYPAAVVLLTAGLKDGEAPSEAARIFDCAHDEHFTRDPDEGVPIVISEDFDGLASSLALQRNLPHDGQVLYGMLQYLLDSYASILLSKHWLKLAAGTLFLDQPLLARIAQDVRVTGWSAMAREVVERGLTRFLYEVAFLLAVRLHRQLGAINGLPSDAIEFRLLPLPDPRKQSEARAVFAVSTDASRPLDGLIIFAADGHQGCAREQDIPLEHRYACGLLTHFPAYTRYTRPE